MEESFQRVNLGHSFFNGKFHEGMIPWGRFLEVRVH